MLDTSGNTEIEPVEGGPPAPLDSRNGLSPVGRTLLIAVVALCIWSAVMLGLVSAGVLKFAPALVLIVLAALVLGVEVKRVQGRAPRRNRFGELVQPPIEPAALGSLLEIEQASVREERRVLLAREFCRLSAEALQADPAAPATWPAAETLASLRSQIALLLRSSTDPSAVQLPPGRPQGHITDPDLSDAIDALQQYVDRLARLQRIPMHDPEPLRQLIRDQNHLRMLQDQIIARLREPTGDE
jgi:hypothetical protein